MLPKYHILFGLVFIVFLYFFFPAVSLFGLAIIFLSSILIDVDHVLYYFIKKKSLNFYKAYNWYMKRVIQFNQLSREQKKKIYSGFYLFHGIEWLIILFLLGVYINHFFIFIFIGFSFHFILDTIHEIYCKGTVDKISLIWNYHRFRKLNPVYEK
jgi:hypothetical protein